MNISKQQFEYWKRGKYILAWAGVWAMLQVHFPPEWKDITFYSVNIPILILMLVTVGWCWIVVLIDSRFEKEMDEKRD